MTESTQHVTGVTKSIRPFDLPILMYHHVQSEEVPPGGPSFAILLRSFEQQLDFLRERNYEPITFDHLYGIMSGSLPRTGREVWITFDDGYESFRSLALPALRARDMTATVFIAAGEIGGYNRWDADSRTGYPKRALMDAPTIKEIISAGIEIGTHGWAHRDMTACSAVELSDEIVKSKRYVEDLFGVEVKTFAYPYGRYSKEHFALLDRAGYQGAVSIFSDEPHVTSNLYAMRRVYVHPKDGSFRFRLKLSRAYLRYKAFRGIPREA